MASLFMYTLPGELTRRAVYEQWEPVKIEAWAISRGISLHSLFRCVVKQKHYAIKGYGLRTPGNPETFSLIRTSAKGHPYMETTPRPVSDLMDEGVPGADWE